MILMLILNTKHNHFSRTGNKIPTRNEFNVKTTIKVKHNYKPYQTMKNELINPFRI